MSRINQSVSVPGCQLSGPKSQVTVLSIDLGLPLDSGHLFLFLAKVWIVLLSSIYEHHHLVEAYGLYISPPTIQRHNICFVLVIDLDLMSIHFCTCCVFEVFPTEK